jgi:glycosyltransferase involved in cell wall biosynthesis
MIASTPERRTLRLLLATETYPPEVNGVARTLGRWVEAFAARGHAVSIIHPRRPGESASPERVYGLSLSFYPEVRFGVASPLRLRRMLKRLAPDLVHIATEGPLGYSTLLAARWLRLPIATSFHTNFDHYAAHYGFVGLQRPASAYLRWFHNRTLVTLVPSQATRNRLLADGVRRVEIWSRGVDANLFHPRYRDPELRQSLGLSENDPLLIYVGRLAPEKNLGALLQAFARLRAALPAQKRDKARLALVGGGPETAAIVQAKYPGVVVAGMQHGRKLSAWYASGDVFTFPSMSETFGNVLLEAQASGLPVVGFDCSGVDERVESGVDGLLVPVGGDLAPALMRLCEDRALRERFAQAALAKARAQDWQPIFDELERRYRALVQEHSHHRAGERSR